MRSASAPTVAPVTFTGPRANLLGRPSLRRAVARHRRLLAAGLAAGSVAFGLGALAPDPPPTVPVVVTSRDLPAGTALGAGDLEVARVPDDLVPGGSAPDPTELVGRVLAGGARRGEAITDVRLVGPALASADQGLVAAPVRLADAQVAGLVRVGDLVDVLAAGTDSGLGGGWGRADDSASASPTPARVVASGARVLAVPAPDPDALAATSLDGSLLLLAVTPAVAADLAAAATTGALSIIVR